MLRASTTNYREIRASYDRGTIVVYQAYRDAIAKPALENGRFVHPFSWNRMTWIKPSFLWMMARSNWATKKGQENVLAIRVHRSAFDQALAMGCLTMFDPDVHTNPTSWREEFDSARVHVQWDPERSIHGKKLQHRSLQVGIGSEMIRQFTDEWIESVTDMTPQVKKVRSTYLAGNIAKAKSLLPIEKAYEVGPATQSQLGISG